MTRGSQFHAQLGAPPGFPRVGAAPLRTVPRALPGRPRVRALNYDHIGPEGAEAGY
jgi:hypothetical protein